MPIEIHHNIPIPRKHSSSKYPFAEMQSGDCFFVTPDPGQPMFKTQSSVLTAARIALGAGQVITRRLVQNGVEQLGVWKK